MTTDNIVERRRYNILKALQETDPNCQILNNEIAPIEEAHSWEKRDPLLPGVIIGQAVAVTGDPFTPSTLKNTTAENFLRQLIQSRRQNQPEELMPALWSVQEVTRQDFEWGNGVAQELERRQEWSEPVWKDIISGWSNSDLQAEQYREMMTWFSKRDVYRHHAGMIAESLHGMVRNGGRPHAPLLIDEAEQVALPLWDHLQCDESMPVHGWHEAAFSYFQIGYLTRFWLDATMVRAQSSIGTTFSPACTTGLNQIIADNSLKGDIGTAVLAGQADFCWKGNSHGPKNSSSRCSRAVEIERERHGAGSSRPRTSPDRWPKSWDQPSSKSSANLPSSPTTSHVQSNSLPTHIPSSYATMHPNRKSGSRRPSEGARLKRPH